MTRTRFAARTPKRRGSRGGALASVVRAQLEPLIDPGYRDCLVRLVPTEQEILGVRVPDLRAAARAFAREHEPDLATACATLDALCLGSREEMLFGIELVARHRRAFTRRMWPRVRSWLRHVTCWETCDQLAMNVGGELLGADRGGVAQLLALARSRGKWQRRFALSTASMLVRRGRKDTTAARAVCAAFPTERDPDVRKALRSTLRQIGRYEGRLPGTRLSSRPCPRGG